MKERVIGASVLVGVAVWLIPWVLDGPVPDSEVEAAQVSSAVRSAPLRTQTIRLDDQRNSSARADATDIPGAPAPQGSGDAPEVMLEVSAAAQPGAPEAPAPVRATPEAAAGSPSGSAVGAPAVAPREEASESNPASSRGTTAAASPAKAGPGWFVQVGSFEEEENARRLADRLADGGYPAKLYPHISGGRMMYRVRLGPEPSREDADAIASSLRDELFVAQVVSGD